MPVPDFCKVPGSPLALDQLPMPVDFVVVVKNDCKFDIFMDSDRFSFGYEAFRFKIRDMDGDELDLIRAPGFWGRNYPAAVVIPPGGAVAQMFSFDQRFWENMPYVAPGEEVFLKVALENAFCKVSGGEFAPLDVPVAASDWTRIRRGPAPEFDLFLPPPRQTVADTARFSKPNDVMVRVKATRQPRENARESEDRQTPEVLEIDANERIVDLWHLQCRMIPRRVRGPWSDESFPFSNECNGNHAQCKPSGRAETSVSLFPCFGGGNDCRKCHLFFRLHFCHLWKETCFAMTNLK